MTKPQLVAELAKKSDLSQTDVSCVLDALVEVVQEQVLGNGDQVAIPGLGAFKQKLTAPRTGRNPRTGEPVQISAKTKVVFSAASALKK